MTKKTVAPAKAPTRAENLAARRDANVATVRGLIQQGKTAKEIKAALGQGAHLILYGAVKTLGAIPSVPATVSNGGKFASYVDDCTFTLPA